MKKMICLLLAVCMLFAMAACGAEKETSAQENQTPAEESPAPAEENPAPAEESLAPAEPEIKDWTRAGYFQDENSNMLSVTWMEDIDEPGWYVGVMIGELMAGGTLPQEGNSLRGNLSTWEEGAEPIAVTVSEEGEDGLLLVVEGGESYHFTPYDMPEATIVVTINTEGMGNIDWAEGEEAPVIDPDYPFQSAYIGLAEPKVHTFIAWPHAGSVFVKWTKNGEDFSTEPQITVLLDESAEFIAVFEDDPGWQNPVMNFVGEYACDRAHALVECFGFDEAWITVTWGSSAWETARWDIYGRLDTDTLTIAYSDCTKSVLTYADSGELISQEVEYEGGTGTIVFHDDGTFTWHENQSEYGVDMLFEWVPVNPALARQDGERFEAVIILEGMEETVQYEHIVNEALGFEMDYDYESFVRHSEADRECFISVWDDPQNPENYLEVICRAEDAEAVEESVRAELSRDFDLTESGRELDRAGECIYIEASVEKGTNRMPDQLQMVYIIPAPEGCFVAKVHCETVEAEGFAKRFSYMLNTLAVIDR